MIEVAINFNVLDQLRLQLGIRKEIKVELINSDTPGVEAELKGAASPWHEIRLVVGRPEQVADRLRWAHEEIVRTLLHEVKHIQQFQDWTPEMWKRDKLHSYGCSPAEAEANEFAEATYQEWRHIITLRRRVKSRLARLSTAEQNVRRCR
jgi:hypothetical protein